MKVLRRKVQQKQLPQNSLIVGVVTLVSVGAIFTLFERGLAQQTSPQKIQVEMINKEPKGWVNQDLGGQSRWEWIKLASPLVIGTGAVVLFQWLNAERDKEIAAERHRQEVLTNYFNQITELIIKQDVPDIKLKLDEITLTVIRARTLAVLRELDGKRKGSLIRFLIGSDIIQFIFLSVADLHEADLREVYLEKVKLAEADLTRADLQGADLKGADLAEAKLREAFLFRSDLAGCDLRVADLFGADLRETDLKQADLRGADLRAADLSGANLEEADLRAVDLRGANLSNAFLFKADLEGADLRVADLEEADLRATNLFRVNFEGANLKSVKLKGARNATKEQLKIAKNLTSEQVDYAVHSISQSRGIL